MNSRTSQSAWICCQIGAREHYAVPRALHLAGALDALLTDAWQTPDAARLPGGAGQRLAERFHPELATAQVIAFNSQLLRFEIGQRLRRSSAWDRILARNAWFEKRVVAWLRKHCKENQNRTLLAYSYAARDLFREAKKRGWRTVLCQIDPGPVEEEIVRAEHARHPNLETTWQPAPAGYWERWREECDLADHILVNSPWSRDALEQTGIAAAKIHVVPLACERAPELDWSREYPASFSEARPLRVLFLGQVCVRKGAGYLLEAARMLQDEPIEFLMVGPSEIKNPGTNTNIRWFGSVPRSETARFYREADVFLFPTLSDGFGLTQLEAQAWKLPIVASRFCGEVVTDGVNGWQLPKVSANTIAEALAACLRRPAMLADFSSRAISPASFDLQTLQRNLESLR